MLSRRLGRDQDKERAVAPALVSGKTKRGKIVALPNKDEEVLSSILAKVRNTTRKPRLGPHLHVSDLISKCARKRAIVERNDVPLPVTKLTLMDALTFRQGDAIHDVIKERAAAGGPSLVWGRWRCQCGSHRVNTPCTSDEVDRSVVCANCEQTADVYEEAEFVDSELQVVGHPDLLLWFSDLSAFYVTELKSISSDQFKELVRPKPEHVIQVLMYWYIMHRQGRTLIDTVSLLYITKGYTFRGVPYKEYLIDVPSSLKRLEPYLEDAKAILAARKGGELPPRVTCAARESPDARCCEVVDLCFGNGAKVKTSPVSFSQAIKRRG